MSIKDFIKSSILDKFQIGDIDYISITISLVVAFLLGLLVFAVYTIFFGGVVYSRGFAITLIGMSVLTCMVTLAISTNIVISLGMVGSLSIIRYRTAVKSPLDLLYLFWAVTVGITAGARMYLLALICSAVMFVVILIFHFKPLNSSLYIVVIHYTGEKAYEDIQRILGRGRYHVKSKTMYKDRTEMALEVTCNKTQLKFYDTLRSVDGVQDVTFVQYNGEYHG